MTSLRLILGDQLSQSISSLKDINPAEDLVMICEVKSEATYVSHHKKKIAFLFSAMRHFSEELKFQGFRVHYSRFDDPQNSGSLLGEVQRVLAKHPLQRIVVTEPNEYRLLKDMQTWSKHCAIPVEISEDHRFLCTSQEFEHWSKGKKQLRMEYFYREMRKKYQVLMDGDQPLGGQWNFDQQNRKPADKHLNIPSPYSSTPDAISQDVIKLVHKHFTKHFGDLEPFYFAVNRSQALKALEQFIEKRLSLFGDYQDAMLQNEPWMYHSHLSFYLNCGLLEPLECIRAAEQAYHQNQAPLNAVEGFIRQILGWREFVRGIYWLKMPKYAEENFFNAQRALPDFYWTGQTDMNCLKQCITETKQNAYAHHIQRLMVLGNFALLAGIDPKQVNEWFLIVYADAYEWVELPNVSGMILYADGGYLASKPYAAGGNYIHKMSNYCQSCVYKVNQKQGKAACPFNYLYWDFLARNRSKLSSNPRMGMMYRTYDRMSEEKRKAITEDSQKFLAFKK